MRGTRRLAARRGPRPSAALLSCGWRAANASDDSAATMMCFGRDDVDAVGERRADQVGIEQRDDAAGPRDAEPDRHVFRPVRHQQADRRRPCRGLAPSPSAHIGWRALRQRAIGQASRVSESSAGARRTFAPAPRSRAGNTRAGFFAIGIVMRSVRSAPLRKMTSLFRRSSRCMGGDSPGKRSIEELRVTEQGPSAVSGRRRRRAPADCR